MAANGVPNCVNNLMQSNLVNSSPQSSIPSMNVNSPTNSPSTLTNSASSGTNKNQQTKQVISLSKVIESTLNNLISNN
jgi:hypothetical protein